MAKMWVVVSKTRDNSWASALKTDINWEAIPLSNGVMCPRRQSLEVGSLYLCLVIIWADWSICCHVCGDWCIAWAGQTDCNKYDLLLRSMCRGMLVHVHSSKKEITIHFDRIVLLNIARLIVLVNYFLLL
jgi:hypothetical protein